MRSTEDALVTIVRSPRFRRWLGTIFFLVAAIVILRSSVIDVDLVPSASMRPTIEPGDRIIVNKLAFGVQFPLTRWRLATWSTPKRGDVIVFVSPADGLRLVKRVVAVGGDTVQVFDDALIVNGAACTYRPAANGEWLESNAAGTHAIRARIGQAGARYQFGPITVPAGTVFAMGDNRDGCIDSRNFGCIRQSAIVGGVRRIAFSLDPRAWIGWRGDRFWINVR